MTTRARAILSGLVGALAVIARGSDADAEVAQPPKPTPPKVSPVAISHVPTPQTADPAPPKVSQAQMHVTLGAVKRLGSGRFAVTDPKVRMVVPTTQDDAEVDFRYLGPTAKTAPLASGEIRRQVGIKLRAANGCNVVYAMWRFEPKNELVVSVKRNDGKSIHAQCGAHGYRDVAPGVYRAPPAPRVGASHALRAKITQGRLHVSIDDKLVWDGALPGEAFAFDGPTGLRSDNVRLELDFHARPRPAGLTSFVVVASDED